MLTASITFVVLFLVFAAFFVGMADMEEVGFFISAGLAMVIAFGIFSEETSKAIPAKPTNEINLSVISDGFAKVYTRIEALEARKCECEPVVIEQKEVDPYSVY